MNTVTLTTAQWERVIDVLGATGNDAIAGDIAIQLHPESGDSR